MSELNPHIYTSKLPVRWGDFDRYGHITNSAYIELAQEARMQHGYAKFDDAGVEMPAIVVRKLDIEYLRTILPNTEEVTIETSVIQVGTSSFTTRQEVKCIEGKVACVVECVSVMVDINTGRSRAITKSERFVLEEALAPSV